MAAPGLYLHVPFCSAICPYCDFSVLKAGVPARQRFVRHLVAEVALAGPGWSDPRPFDTVYFGGGTPSLLPSEDLERVLGACRSHLMLATPWVFLEANPEDVTPGACAGWRGLGVRTLSLGVQSFSDEALRFLGRRHGAEQARAAVGNALAAGFDTVSVDLIFGLPGQAPDAWRRDLETAVALAPGHLSCYQLTIHPRTRFGVAAGRGRLSEMPEGEQAVLFELTHQLLADAGYRAYEVSNFARGREHESRHNRKYWDHTPYLGLGPSAHSLDRRGRRRPTGGPPLVERAAHAALGEPRCGGRAARRRRGVPRREGAGDGGRDAGPAHHGRDRPGRLHGALQGRPGGRERGPRGSPGGRGSPRRARRAGRRAGSCRRRPGWGWRTAWRRRSTSRSRAEPDAQSGWSTLDAARALIWLRVVAERRARMSHGAQR